MTDDTDDDARTDGDANDASVETGANETADSAGHDELIHPLSLQEDPDVDYEEGSREFDAETFERLRERYAAISGVPQVALRDGDGRILLFGDGETVAPPGWEVRRGEDWVAVTRDAMAALTGQRVRIDRPFLLERTWFRPEGDLSEHVGAVSVHFAATLVDPDPGFLDDPAVPAAYDHPLYPDADPVLEWHDAVPEHVHPNHAAHVERYLALDADGYEPDNGRDNADDAADGGDVAD